MVAVVLAVLLSPVGPVGVARAADPRPGFEVDGWLLALSGSLLVVAVVVVSVYPAWRHASARPIGQEARRSVVASAMARSGLPVPAVTGVRFAVEPGRGRTAVPVRSTLLGAVSAVAIVAAALTFASSMNNLLDTPRLYGSDWDAVVSGDSNLDDPNALSEATGSALAGSSQVRGYAAAESGEVVLAGASVPALAFAQGSRPVDLTLVEGRAPKGPDEVVLGTATLAELGLAVGDVVTVDGVAQEDGDRLPAGTLDIVGRAVLPGIGQYPGSDKPSLGRGAVLTPEGLRAHSSVENTVGFVVALGPGSSPARLEEELRGTIELPDPESWFVRAVATQRPSDIVSLGRLRSTPVILSGILVLLVAATVVNALLAAIRRRRRDLAVLEVFGATRRQVLATVAWQASTIAVVGVVIGVPVGVVVGRWIWSELATSMDTIAPPIVPVLALTAMALVVVVFTNLVGLVPGLRASRSRPAVALRSE